MNHSEYDGSNPAFCRSGVNPIENCLWGVNSLPDTKDQCAIPSTHIQDTAIFFFLASYTLEKAATRSQIIIGK